MTPKALVLGGNFAGVTAALSLKRELGADVDVTVVSTSSRFTFNPSFIWVPFGKRTRYYLWKVRHGYVQLPYGSGPSRVEPDRKPRKMTGTASTQG